MNVTLRICTFCLFSTASLHAYSEQFVVENPAVAVNGEVIKTNPIVVDGGVAPAVDKGIIIIIGPDGKQYHFNAENAANAPIIVRDLVKPYLVPEASLEEDDLYFIGVTLNPVPEEYRGLVGAEDDYGLLINGVIDDGPASLAGLQKYDVILKANGRPVRSVAQMQSVFRLSENNPVDLVIRRKLETLDVEVQAILWQRLNDEAKVVLRRHKVRCYPESMEPYMRRQFVRDLRYLNGDLDDDILMNEELASENDVQRLQRDINVLRGEFEARQELMLKKLDELQSTLEKNQEN